MRILTSFVTPLVLVVIKSKLSQSWQSTLSTTEQNTNSTSNNSNNNIIWDVCSCLLYLEDQFQLPRSGSRSNVTKPWPLHISSSVYHNACKLHQFLFCLIVSFQRVLLRTHKRRTHRRMQQRNNGCFTSIAVMHVIIITIITLTKPGKQVSTSTDNNAVQCCFVA